MDLDKDKAAALHVLRIALLEIREQARLSGDTRSYGLADVIHTLPGMIEAASSSGDWKAVLLELRERAERIGCSKWVDNCIRQV